MHHLTVSTSRVESQEAMGIGREFRRQIGERRRPRGCRWAHRVASCAIVSRRMRWSSAWQRAHLYSRL